MQVRVQLMLVSEEITADDRQFSDHKIDENGLNQRQELENELVELGLTGNGDCPLTLGIHAYVTVNHFGNKITKG